MEKEKLLLAFHLEQQEHPFAFLYDSIYGIIQQAIISGSFAPGSDINVKEISLVLNVSPTPVARAFSMLERDGLLTPMNGTNYSVVGYNYHTLRDIMNFRSMLEPSIAFQVARYASKEEIAELTRLVRLFKKYSSDDARFILNISENEMQFSKKCCEICNSFYLRKAFHQNQAAIYRSILFINTQMFEHPDIMISRKRASVCLFYENYSNTLYAIKSRNGRMAMDAVYSHLRVVDIRSIQFSEEKSQKALTYTDK